MFHYASINHIDAFSILGLGSFPKNNHILGYLKYVNPLPYRKFYNEIHVDTYLLIGLWYICYKRSLSGSQCKTRKVSVHFLAKIYSQKITLS